MDIAADPREPSGDVTQLLIAWRQGDQNALERLVPRVSAELHRIALRHLSRESAGHSLDAGALVNEVYLRLIDWKSVQWENRAHFFAVAAKVMRRILVSHAMNKNRVKRGGEFVKVPLDEAAQPAARPRDLDVIALDQALEKLAQLDERKSKIIELRFFGGLSEKEVAAVMETSLRTVERDWNFARAWLYRELSSGSANAMGQAAGDVF